jgi:hypothetical protein
MANVLTCAEELFGDSGEIVVYERNLDWSMCSIR